MVRIKDAIKKQLSLAERQAKVFKFREEVAALLIEKTVADLIEIAKDNPNQRIRLLAKRELRRRLNE